MKSDDEADLREMQGELMAAERSPWEPGCVAQAFGSRRAEVGSFFVFTMQVWIDLSRCESPFLLGRLPAAERVFTEFEAAFVAFGYERTTPEACEPEELILLGWQMVEAIARGFAMRLKLAPPGGCKLAGVDNGLGDWLPIFTCLKSQLYFSGAEALELPVAHAFGLIGAHRVNEGWTVAGETYALREVEGHGDSSSQPSTINSQPS